MCGIVGGLRESARAADVRENAIGRPKHRDLTEVVIGGMEAIKPQTLSVQPSPRLTERMPRRDARQHLPDSPRVEIDRVAMSLETRIPMPDHRLFDLAWCLSPHSRAGRRNCHYHLWDSLVYQAGRERWRR